jgi:hypothetical protein
MGPYKKNLQVTIYFYQYGVEPIVSPSSSPIAQVCLSLFFFQVTTATLAQISQIDRD